MKRPKILTREQASKTHSNGGKQCANMKNGFTCTRKKGHTGNHVAHESSNDYCAQWNGMFYHDDTNAGKWEWRKM